MRIGIVLLLLFAPGLALDFAKVDRRIGKQPAYVAQPLYALFLFGPEADVRVWAVLDKSKTGLEYYDVCYFDFNANGDLTDEGERVQAAWNEAGARAGMAVELKLGDFTEPGTGHVHKALRVSTVRKKGRKGIWFRMKWRGLFELSGGQTIDGDCTEWGPSPANAPILRPTVEAPFTFAFWGWGRDRVTLPVGGAEKVYLMAGVRGSQPDTLLVVDEHFLKPGEDRLFATLLARTTDGAPLEVRTEITGHC